MLDEETCFSEWIRKTKVRWQYSCVENEAWKCTDKENTPKNLGILTRWISISAHGMWPDNEHWEK